MSDPNLEVAEKADIKVSEEDNMIHPDEPLWLPRGSIRAIMSLTIVAVLAGRLAFGYSLDPEELGLLAGIFAAYGISRWQETKDE